MNELRVLPVITQESIGRSVQLILISKKVIGSAYLISVRWVTRYARPAETKDRFVCIEWKMQLFVSNSTERTLFRDLKAVTVPKQVAVGVGIISTAS
jgi:hypothetical protein